MGVPVKMTRRETFRPCKAWKVRESKFEEEVTEENLPVEI